MTVTIAFAYDFSTQTTDFPSSNQLRFNAGYPYTSVAEIFAAPLTTDGIDVSLVLLAITPGATIFVQDKNDSLLSATFRVIGTPSLRVQDSLVLAAAPDNSYVAIPVVHHDHGQPLNNNQNVQMVALTGDPTAPDTPTYPLPPDEPLALPPLASLAEAKTHLRITTADGDEADNDIQAKLDAAQAIIVDYLASTPVWRDLIATWHSGNVPLQVKHAILLELGELYRFRGDDSESPTRWDDHDLSPAIVGLLRRTRDPVVA